MTPEDAERALESVLRSTTFERSERLRTFLKYVCELTLNGESDRINEYLIGVEVFGRGGNYTPTEDSVVRRQAHALRAKLEKHYADEGAASPVRIELPIGHYVPVFRRAEHQVALLPPHLAPSQTPARRRPFWMLALGYLGGAVLLFAAGWYAASSGSQNTAGLASINPALREIWGPWLEDPIGATICLSNPKTWIIKHYPNSHPEHPSHIRLAEGGPRANLVREFFAVPPGGELCEYPSVGQAKMGEAMGAIHLASLFAHAGVPVRTQHGRFLDWGQLRRENIILFGHSENNEWVSRFLSDYPLHVASSSEEEGKRIINVQPREGEAQEYHHDGANGPVHVLVSMLPGVDERHRLLLISGLNAMGAQFGAEFLTNPSHMEELLRMLRAADPKRTKPWYFQVLLSSQVRENTVPTHGTIEVLRVL